MTSNLNVPHEKMTDFVSFLLFRFTLVIKLRNFDFENHRNTLIFFIKKNNVKFDCVLWVFLQICDPCFSS